MIALEKNWWEESKGWASYKAIRSRREAPAFKPGTANSFQLFAISATLCRFLSISDLDSGVFVLIRQSRYGEINCCRLLLANSLLAATGPRYLANVPGAGLCP